MELAATHLRLPAALPYPLTVQRIHAQPGTHVRKTQRLLTYSFLPSKLDEQGRRERQVREWDSPVQGEVIAWDVREGDVIREPRPLVKVQEPCTHDVQLNGLCAICGKDLTATDYTGFSDTSRATISMVHDVGGLTVSLEEAHRLESATASRLLQAKKLSLIVDLDQTIVHATVDPTVGEWLQDPKNPNYKALEGVKRFKLLDDVPVRRPKRSRTSTGTTTPGLATPLPTPGLSEALTTEDGDPVDEDDDAPGCYYYIKMRPGLPDFLKRIAEMYEMHVYTMGTRAYAIEVCKVIDPDGGLFGGRILSRDESGSMTRKSLQRLFPCDTNMVVIIDDRADVWDGSPNLVKVIPYEFFVGIGDINAAFLPKKKELVPPPTAPLASPPLTEAAPLGGGGGPASPLDLTVAGGEVPPSGERSTTPLASPSPGPPPSPLQSPTSMMSTSNAAAEAAVHHLHLPDEILSEPTRISDLVVSSSPEEVVSPSMEEASEHAKETIHDLIEARPLEKARREADALHHLNHHSPSPKSPSRSPLLPPPSPTPVGTGGGDATASASPPMEVQAVETATEPGSTLGFAGEETEEEDDDDYEEQPVLRDDDRELDRLFDILSSVRNQFYEEHQSKGVSDVATIIPGMKAQTLRDTNIVFSGLVALGTRAEESEYWKLATTFGAQCSNLLSPKVTHLVANQPGTAKVHSAKRFPRVKVVYPQWLLDSVARWVRLDEGPYLLPTLEDRQTTPPSPVRPELSDGENDNKTPGAEVGDIRADQGGDLDLAGLDWGDAMKEVDDLLLETDDDEDSASVLNGDDTTTDGESDAGGVPSSSRSSVGPGRRKRPRVSSTLATDYAAGSDPTQAAAAAAESPLQKRVKTARSRRSGLKTSLSAVEGDVFASTGASSSGTNGTVDAVAAASLPAGANSLSASNGGTLSEVVGKPNVVADETSAADASQASSSIGSDDEDLLAMAADLESGWS